MKAELCPQADLFALRGIMKEKRNDSKLNAIWNINQLKNTCPPWAASQRQKYKQGGKSDSSCVEKHPVKCFFPTTISSSLPLSLYAKVLFPATPLVSLICDILMAKEGFHFSFPNQTLEVTFLKSPFKSKKITSSKTLARSSYCVKLMFKSLLTFLIFKVPGSREWLCCFDILSGSKMPSELFFEERKKKTRAEFLSFLAATVAHKVHFSN